MLSRIRVGYLNKDDLKILNSRKISFTKTNCHDKLMELCDYIDTLSSDTVCLLPTRHMCEALNTEMLRRISTDEIQLVSCDAIECPNYLKKKMYKALQTDDENCSKTVRKPEDFKKLLLLKSVPK